MYYFYFQYGLYCHAIYSQAGGWPAAVARQIADNSRRQGYSFSRLPEFTQEENDLVRGEIPMRRHHLFEKNNTLHHHDFSQYSAGQRYLSPKKHGFLLGITHSIATLFLLPSRYLSHLRGPVDRPFDTPPLVDLE